jgi:outer membrane protein assembly factor BamB
MKRICLVVILIVGCVFLSACDSLISERDNTLPPAPLTKIVPKINVAEVWSTRVGDGANKYYLRMQPTVAKNLIYTASYNGNICATDINTGRTVWKTNVKTHLTSGVSVNAGRLFVATEQGRVIALSLTDKQQLWSTQVGSTVLAAPRAYNGIVLAKSIDGSLTGLSEINGRLLWRFSQTVPPLILHASSQPQFANNLVVAGFANGVAAAINAWNGKVLWVRRVAQPRGVSSIENMIDIDVNPIIVFNTVYVATYQGYLMALDLKTGNKLWQHKISSYAGMAADSTRVYISDAKSHIWVFDRSSGASLWRQTELQGRNVTGPAVLGNYVIVADGYGYLHWLSKSSGTIVARNNLHDRGVLTPPIVVGNMVFVYSRDGQLTAFCKR